MSSTQINFEFNQNSNVNLKPNPFVRMGHVSCSYGRFVILWGGLNRVSSILFLKWTSFEFDYFRNVCIKKIMKMANIFSL